LWSDFEDRSTLPASYGCGPTERCANQVKISQSVVSSQGVSSLLMKDLAMDATDSARFVDGVRIGTR